MKEIQHFLDLLRWSNTAEADAVLNSPPQPSTTLNTVWGILILLMLFAQVFGLCFAFKKLVYNKIARVIKARRQMALP